MQRWATWIARRLWWGSLWLMRRRWIRRLQDAPLRWMGPERAERARRGLVRQNVLARRIGLPLLSVAVTLFLCSLAIQVVYSTAIYLVDSGVLKRRVPEDASSAD